MAVELRYGDYIKGGWEIVKPNLVPSIVATLCMCIPILNIQIIINYMRMVKDAKNGGKPIDIGGLFNFDNIVNNIIAMLIIGVANGFCFLIGPLFLFAPCILADKPGIGFMDAVKGSLGFGKGNYVPSLIFMIVCGILLVICEILCFLPILVGLPIVLAAHVLAYEEHKAAVAAAAAEMGVTLA